MTAPVAPTLPDGAVLAATGVVAFSLSLPATKLAVATLDPWFVAFGRAVVAAALGALVLGVGRAPWPTAAQWRGLALVALGVVVGFPLLTSLALERVDAAHGGVVVGVLPAATAAFAVLRAGERPPRAFWLSALAGLAAVLAFTLSRGVGGLERADAELLAAVLVCAVGYAEGGRLARELGGARTICWALLLALPVSLPVAAAHAGGLADATASAWAGFAYVALVSMFLGFFAWYAGLARGGIARMSQLQLAQPVLTLVWSALLLGETVSAPTALCAAIVIVCVAATQRTRAGAVAQTRA